MPRHDALHRMLSQMLTATENDDLEDAEAVRDCPGGCVWVGTWRFSPTTLDKAIQYMLVRDVSDSGGMERYTINDAGQAYLKNPGIVRDMQAAIAKGGAWTITEGKLVELGRPD